MKYTINKALVFPGVSQDPDVGLREKISECLDVMEGAWNSLYRPRPGDRSQKVIGSARRRIQEGISNFHTRLLIDSNNTINLAVFGTEGAGKSSLLNFLLNQGNQGGQGNLLNEVPLPSGKGTRQTRLPIYVKYANTLQVLLHKERDESKAEVLYPNSKPKVEGTNPLIVVRDLLKSIFHKEDILKDATHIELKGPFAIFPTLEDRRITNSNHLEFKVDFTLVDLPGLREDQKGDKVLLSELSKADVILFFTSGQEGREVTPHDLANVFRQHGEFDFPSRPKLIHVVKASKSDNFEILRSENQETLKKVWKEFFEDSEGNACYRLAREKVPMVGGEDLLKKLKDESEVLVFHPENEDFVTGLRSALSRHIQHVKMKKSFHPSLKDLHQIAKDLKKTISTSVSKANKAPQNFPKVTIDEAPPFEIIPDEKEAESHVENFLGKYDEECLQQEDLGRVLKDFMYADDTSCFVQKILQGSLLLYSQALMDSLENKYRAKSVDISDGLRPLAKMVCHGKIRRFCAHRALSFYHFVLEKNCFTLLKPTRQEQSDWSVCDEEDRKSFLGKCLIDKLGEVWLRLVKARDKETVISLLKDSLKNDVEELFLLRSVENVPLKPDVLNRKLELVINFASDAIRDYNPKFDLSTLDSYDHTKGFPKQLKMRSIDKTTSGIPRSDDKIIKDMIDFLKTKKGDPIRELEKKLKFEKKDKALALPKNVDPGKWPWALLNVLSDKDHFDIPLDEDFAFNDETLLSLARKHLFAFQRSRVECQIMIVKTDPNSEDEIRVKKHTEQPNVLVVSMTSETQKDLDKICTGFTDCKTQVAPVFIPTIRPGPQQERKGNYFLQENPWAGCDETAGNKDNSAILEFNIFLVVEERHLKVLKSTIAKETLPRDRKINLKYIVLPQNGRGIGVARAIIKSLAECFKFDLYWTVGDDIKFMYQFNEDDGKWHKCTFGRGLLFGQQVFQHRRQSTLKQLPQDDKDELVDEVLDYWPKWAKKSRREARSRLVDESKLQELTESPGLLHSPFTAEIISEDCGEDNAKKDELQQVERKFVETCRNHLFEDAVNRIAGVSLANKSTGNSDYMGRYPSAHFMPSTQRYHVVLHNTAALRERNYVTDDMIFCDEENQITEQTRRNCDRSFIRALDVSGIIGYQVICIHHVQKKRLANTYEKIGKI